MAVRQLSKSTIAQGLPRGSKFWDQVSSEGSFESIATVTVGAGGGTISFTSIPQTYAHLQIRGIFKSSAAISSSGAGMRLNGSTSTYPRHDLKGNGSTAYSQNSTVSNFAAIDAATDTYNQFGAVIIDILDYANANKYKTTRTLFGMDNNGSGGVGLISDLYMSTSAVDSITLYGNNLGNFAQYSHFALYGIKA